MIMGKVLSTAFIISLLFTACQNADTSTESNSYDSTIITDIKSDTVLTDPQPVVQNVDNIQQVIPDATTAPVTTTLSTSQAATGLNPAHGEPGHRCDITVGAPLNSTPAKTSIATPAQPAVINTTAPNPVKTAPGMNPPHGEPGHKCEISVGAPLNSAPAKSSTNKTDGESKTAETSATSILADTSGKQ